jgi:hypothetical protein
MRSLALTSVAVASCLAAAGCVPSVPATPGTTPATYSYSCPARPITIAVAAGEITVYSGGGIADIFRGGPTTYFGEEESITFGPNFNSVTWSSLGEQEVCTRPG